jgi:hypothetical protein
MDASEKLLESSKTPTCAEMWNILATMRGDLAKSFDLVDIATPNAVRQTAQFVPVITSLITILYGTREIQAAVAGASKRRMQLLVSARTASQQARSNFRKKAVSADISGGLLLKVLLRQLCKASSTTSSVPSLYSSRVFTASFSHLAPTRPAACTGLSARASRSASMLSIY